MEGCRGIWLDKETGRESLCLLDEERIDMNLA